MKFTPRPYQKLALDHLLDVPRCALWAGMGMGKTSSTLTALDALWLAGESMPALVLAPLRVARDTWPNEAAKWDHLRHVEVQAVVGDRKERLAALRNRNASVFTVNYENLPWLSEALDGAPWPFGTVVSDESTKLKSHRGSVQRSKHGKEFVRSAGGIRSRELAKVAHTKVKRFVELTGTPSPNGLHDLWGQVWFLDQGQRLGRTYEAFIQRWFKPKHDGYGVEPLPFAPEQIQDRLRDICLTLDPADWFDLQEPIKHVVRVELPKAARNLYRDMEKDFFMQVERHEIEAFNAASKSMKLRQLCSGAVYVDQKAETWKEVHDEKAQALESIVEEAGGAPVLVAYQFKSDLARLMKVFPKGVWLAKREGMTAFKSGKAPIGFAHPASMGHGIDGLQDVCNTIVFFAHDWNLEERQQIIERIGPVRQAQAGYNRPVWVYDIVAADTIDEVVLARHETKRGVQDLLLEAMKRRKTT